MARDLDTSRRRILNTLLAKTNDYQGEWTSLRDLLTTTSSAGTIPPNDVEATLDELEADGLVERRDDEVRVVDGVDRIPHPGEKRKE